MSNHIIATPPAFIHRPNEIFGETAITYTRTDGCKVEMVIQHPSWINETPELVIGVGTPEEMCQENYPNFVFSLEEIRLFRALLNNPEVVAMVGE